jgi:hypothetical protein
VPNDNKGISRRTLLGGGVAAMAAAGLTRAARAQDKIPPEAVMYVDKTQNMDQFCANCLHWQGDVVATFADLDESSPARAACAIVSGDLASTGWCGVWAPRG